MTDKNDEKSDQLWSMRNILFLSIGAIVCIAVGAGIMALINYARLERRENLMFTTTDEQKMLTHPESHFPNNPEINHTLKDIIKSIENLNHFYDYDFSSPYREENPEEIVTENTKSIYLHLNNLVTQVNKATLNSKLWEAVLATNKDAKPPSFVDFIKSQYPSQ